MTEDKWLADGALVINLDERADRWQRFTEHAAPLLHPLEPQRLSAVKGVAVAGFGQAPYFRNRKRDRTWAGRAGCALSHRAAIQKAATSGWQRVLILEDDIEIATDFPALATPLASALEENDWGVCYLGFTDPIGPFRPCTKLTARYDLAQIYGCNTTHAYLVHARAYPFLLSALPDESSVWHWLTRKRAIDRWYARTLSRHMAVLAVTPSAINQQNDISDITGRAHEKTHTTALPTLHRATRLDHTLRSTLRILQLGLEGLYDEARGLIKRTRGF